jgi:hypothetical protein
MEPEDRNGYSQEKGNEHQQEGASRTLLRASSVIHKRGMVCPYQFHRISLVFGCFIAPPDFALNCRGRIRYSGETRDTFFAAIIFQATQHLMVSK